MVVIRSGTRRLSVGLRRLERIVVGGERTTRLSMVWMQTPLTKLACTLTPLVDAVQRTISREVDKRLDHLSTWLLAHAKSVLAATDSTCRTSEGVAPAGELSAPHRRTP